MNQKLKAVINPNYHSLEEFSGVFQSALPFPHLILDDFLLPEFFALFSGENKRQQGEIGGKNFDTSVEEKKWISLNSDLPGHISKLVVTLNDPEWINSLRRLTGMNSLSGTKFGNTNLANYHEMQPGGFLAPHVDHGSEPITGRPHVLNIITYLSDEWRDDYGGSTLFYDQKGKEIVSKVAYKPNRAVIFLHTPYSFHCVERIKPGLPTIRKSLYVDYYSDSLEPYKNINLPFPSKWFDHPTTFNLNSVLDYFKPSNINYFKAKVNYLLNKMKAG